MCVNCIRRLFTLLSLHWDPFLFYSKGGAQEAAKSNPNDVQQTSEAMSNHHRTFEHITISICIEYRLFTLHLTQTLTILLAPSQSHPHTHTTTTVE